MIACAYSGGLDSTVALLELVADLAVFVDYGQAAATAESNAARRVCDRFGIELRTVTVRGLALGRMADPSGAPGPRVVQARNALILAAVANHVGAGDTVIFGAHLGDAELYPDCRTYFVDRLSSAFLAGYGVTVHAPLALYTKRELLIMLGRHALDWRLCWSCYTPATDGDPCGTCSSCVERELACASIPR